MTETFSGDWTIEVAEQHKAVNRWAYIIEGSLAADGVYPIGPDTQPVSVSGPKWFIRCVFGPKKDQPVDIGRSAAEYTREDGLAVFIAPKRDLVEGHIVFVLRLRNVDPKLNPWLASEKRYNFTRPKSHPKT